MLTLLNPDGHVAQAVLHKPAGNHQMVRCSSHSIISSRWSVLLRMTAVFFFFSLILLSTLEDTMKQSQIDCTADVWKQNPRSMDYCSICVQWKKLKHLSQKYTGNSWQLQLQDWLGSKCDKQILHHNFRRSPRVFQFLPPLSGWRSVSTWDEIS